MIIKFLRDNLPWVAPSAAIVFAASGYFDRGSRSVTPVSQPAVQVGANLPVQSASATVAAQEAVSQLQPEQAVTRLDTNFDNSLTAPFQPEDKPSFTNTEIAPQVAPEEVTVEAASLEANPSAFFQAAQAKLNAANSCKDDLRVLASQAHVYFPSGGLTEEENGLVQARLIGTVLQGCKGVGILVTGHSDPSGDPAANLRLSQRRAEHVIQRIGASGIDTANFVAQGFGDRQPSSIRGAKSRAYYDRRVEFTVVDLQATASAAFTANTRNVFTPSCVSQLQEQVAITKLYYAPRSIAAQSGDLDAVLKLARLAQACPQARLRVIGQHTDDAWAGEDVNTGILRAKALMSVLVGQGIASEKVIIAAPSRSVGVQGKPDLSNSRVDFDVIVDQG